MSGFDHTAHQAAVAGALEYAAGGRTVRWLGHDFPALIESLPPRLAPSYDRQAGNDTLAAVTIARHLFAAKPVRLPKVGDSLAGPGGQNYRVQKIEGAPTDAEIRFVCGTVIAL